MTEDKTPLVYTTDPLDFHELPPELADDIFGRQMAERMRNMPTVAVYPIIEVASVDENGSVTGVSVIDKEPGQP